tara:strand:- start:4164 stop:5192 length:1029 start_codon:yes stop_codon:yes gene_type:complete
MSETEIIHEEPNIPDTPVTTEEDKFFGKTTEINNSVPEDLKVEVVDDTPQQDRRPPKDETAETEVTDESLDEEITDYSKRAGDRINKLKYDYHEERRAKESAQRESQEAITRLQSLMTENQKLQAFVDQGGEVLNKQAANNALWAKQNAQAMYKAAYEAGDADKMSEAQELLSKAVLAEQTATNMATNVQQEIEKELVIPEAEVPQPQQQVDPELKSWAAKNPWFMGTEPVHKEMTSYAMYIDQNIKAQGIDPTAQADKYYAEVDVAMRKQFPNFFGVVTESVEAPEETTKRQPSTVVATASRESSNKKPSQVRLTQTQVRLARQLGISPEQYANQLLKEAT